MRLLVVVLFLLFQNVYQKPNPAAPATKTGIEKGNTETKAKERNTDNSQQPTQIVVIGGLDKGQIEKRSEQSNSYDPREDTLYRAYLWFTILGVTGAIGGVIVLICQTIATRRSAEAAFMNAQVLIDAERAWIDIDFSKVGTLYSFVVTNYGKTHGIITKCKLIYAPMTNEEYADLPRKLEAREEWGARSPREMYTMLLPHKPVELERLNPASYKSPSDDKIAVVGAIVEYDSIGGPYRTEVVYLVQHDPINKTYDLINVPGLTSYDYADTEE
jgi:hypothetical protein